MIALFMTALEVPTRQLISSVMLIAVGTAIASYGEVNFSIIGVACMFASESFEATRLVMTQIVLVGLKFNAGAVCPVQISLQSRVAHCVCRYCFSWPCLYPKAAT